MKTEADRALLADHDALWTATNRFFTKFTALDWSRKHGAQWTYGEVPYHLAYHNRLLNNAIRAGRDQPHDQMPMMATVQELNRWNDHHFAQRPPGYTGMKAFEEMETTQAALRETLLTVDFDQPVWLPLLRVRGWRTARLVAEYSYWHTWLHLMEAQLRWDDRLPDLSAEQMQRALDLNMEFTTGTVSPADTRSRFVWQLELAQAGQWTFVIQDGRCVVQPGANGKPDIWLHADVPTYLKTFAFEMLPLRTAFLSGKIRVRGAGLGRGLMTARRLPHLFAALPDQEWVPTERGLIA